jgi:diguanylate cyclase (GGDEF)-like protein/PAS domain S-box-containing protein
MWQLDKNYIVRYVNDTDKIIRGFEKNEVMGQPLKKHLTEESFQMIKMLKEIRIDEESRGVFPSSRTVELDLIRKNSLPLTMEVIINYIYDKNILKGFYGTARDITWKQFNESELYFKANNDALTKLYNRRSFMDFGKREFDLAKRHLKPLSVLMLDIDNFKKINDTYGHHAGDEVLKEVARIGSQTLRSTDIFGRIGGEEFSIIATETDLEGAVSLAEKLRVSFEMHKTKVEKHIISFTVSIGVTSMEPSDMSFEDILKRADEFLYIAKNTGKNKVVFYRLS